MPLLNLVYPSDGETHRHGSHPDRLEPSICIDFECTTAVDASSGNRCEKFLKNPIVPNVKAWYLHRLPNPEALPGPWNPGTPTSPKGPNQQNRLKSVAPQHWEVRNDSCIWFRNACFNYHVLYYIILYYIILYYIILYYIILYYIILLVIVLYCSLLYYIYCE